MDKISKWLLKSRYQAPSNLKKVQTTDDSRDVNNTNFPRSASRGRGRGGAARGQGRRRGEILTVVYFL
jgi:hypothetical protein